MIISGFVKYSTVSVGSQQLEISSTGAKGEKFRKNLSKNVALAVQVFICGTFPSEKTLEEKGLAV